MVCGWLVTESRHVPAGRSGDRIGGGDAGTMAAGVAKAADADAGGGPTRVAWGVGMERGEVDCVFRADLRHSRNVEDSFAALRMTEGKRSE